MRSNKTLYWYWTGPAYPGGWTVVEVVGDRVWFLADEQSVPLDRLNPERFGSQLFVPEPRNDKSICAQTRHQLIRAREGRDLVERCMRCGASEKIVGDR